MPAYFHCPRLILNNEKEENNLKAAWTRVRDMALLAVGSNSFTSDFRFQVSKPRDKNSDWVLILRRTELDDIGCYICEINTEPSSIVIPIYLKVIKNVEEQKREEKKYKLIKKKKEEFKTKLETRIEEGTTLLLNCTIERILINKKEENNNNEEEEEYYILNSTTTTINNNNKKFYFLAKYCLEKR
ncbi:Ig-like domain-containing protein [Meloidogyne graminicola]|uniref:Ig-like domain-containing protein n=1 Tax=Meloidogyne graminicola TaxID=189291 RepID=A0A8S9ZDF1_9BILA|nr:Ig-like domain-containing protein [Meloidogyne graminicola]